MNLTWADIATVCNLDRGVADDRFVDIGGPSRSEGQLLAKRVCDKLATYDFVPASEIVSIKPKENIFSLYSLWSHMFINTYPILLTDSITLSGSQEYGCTFLLQKGFNVIKKIVVPLRRTGNVPGDIIMNIYECDYDQGVPQNTTPLATLKVPANSVTTTTSFDPNRTENVVFEFENGSELVLEPNTRVAFGIRCAGSLSPNIIELFRSSVQPLNVNNITTYFNFNISLSTFYSLPATNNTTIPPACKIYTSSTTQSAPIKPINVFLADKSGSSLTHKRYLADPEIWTYDNTAKRLLFSGSYDNLDNLYLEYTNQWLVRDSETNEIKPYFEKGEDIWIMPQDFNECMYQGVLEYVYKKEKRFLEVGNLNDYQIVKSEFQQEINRVLSLIPQVEKKHPQTSSYQY